MTDKLRRTIPLNITLAPGEQPSNIKLTVLATQIRTGNRIIEKAVGDLWNQSGDSLLTSYPLQIPNLARLIGNTGYLSPAIYPTTDTFNFVDHPYRYTGNFEGWLTFKPKTGTTFTVTNGDTYFVTAKSNEVDVTATGDYWIDSTTGRWRVFGEAPTLSSTTTIKYQVDPTDFTVRDHTLPSVIPDVRQESFTGCRISSSDGKYYLHLPPRQPLVLASYETPGRFYSTESAHVIANQATVVDAADLRLWQTTGANTALDHEHYRYSFPKEVADNFATLAPGQSLPEGMMYLWDLDRQTIVEGAIFRKPSNGETRSWILEVESPLVSLAGKVTTSESQGNYNLTKLAVITCGAPLTKSIWTLTNLVLGHDHSNTGDHSAILSHANLSGLNPGGYQSSAWVNDDHPQYLHRDGSPSSSARDDHDNGMKGPLRMGNVSPLPPGYTFFSNPIYFGTLSGGPKIEGLGGLNANAEKALQITTDYFQLGRSLNKWYFDDRSSQTVSTVFFNESQFVLEGLTYFPSQGITCADGGNIDVNVFPSSVYRTVVRITGPTAPYNISGITAPPTNSLAATKDGAMIILLNMTTQTLTINNDDAASQVGNRIYVSLAVDRSIVSNGSCMLTYDSTSAHWIIIS